ncbi:MAG: O-antigen ligase domain-containing protein, partial [Calditrichaeota bacterium]
RSGGTLGSANHLGRYLGLVLPISLALTLTHRRPWMSRFSSLTTVVGTFAIFQTLTRSAWIGLFFSIIIMVFLMFHHRLITFRAVFKLGTMALAMIAIIIALWTPIEKRLFGDDNGSSYTRITTAKVAMRIIRDYPLFGCGINNYGAVLPDYWIAEDVFTREAAVHNNYLLYAAEIGLIGFAAYLWLLMAAGSSIMRAIRSHNVYFATVAVGIMASFGAYLLEALSDKSYKESYTLLLSFWGLLAITEALNRLSKNSKKGL